MSGKFAFVTSTKEANFQILRYTTGKLKLGDLWDFLRYRHAANVVEGVSVDNMNVGVLLYVRVGLKRLNFG